MSKKRICPISQQECLSFCCGWWDAETEGCAIAALPAAVDFLTKITITPPLETLFADEDEPNEL